MNSYTLLYIQQTSNKTYIEHRYTHYPAIPYNGKEAEKEYIHDPVYVCVCVYTYINIYMRSFAVHLKPHNIVNQLCFTLKKKKQTCANNKGLFMTLPCLSHI